MNRYRTPVYFLILFTFLALLQESCASHEFPTYTCPTEPISYINDVHPIIISRCAISGCHNGDNGADKNWTNFDLLQEEAQNGLVHYNVVNRIMPLASSTGGPLSQEQIAIIACWVDQGAQNN
jgi:hypothetical protein